MYEQQQQQQQQQLSEQKTVYVIALPVVHENLFAPFKHYIKETQFTETKKNYFTTKTDPNFLKVLDEINNITSEKYIDKTYKAKPNDININNYILDFLRIKGVANHYTFREIYKINNNSDETFLVIPLYIRLKKGKTLDQWKIIEPDGTVKTIKKEYLIRDP